MKNAKSTWGMQLAALLLTVSASIAGYFLAVSNQPSASSPLLLLAGLNLLLVIPLLLRGSLSAAAQWVATIALAALVVAGILSIGPYFIPAAVVSLVAAIRLTRARHEAPAAA